MLLVNVAMFGVEFVSGLLAGSMALLADSLDMLGDALVYGFSLYVVSRNARWKAWAAAGKASVMGVFGAFVTGHLVYNLVFPRMPLFETMGAVGALALGANAVCFILLWRHRADDINMGSVWLCSRNDLLANVLVVLAAVAVWALGSPWPDLVAGTVIAAVFLRSAFVVARTAREELARTRVRPAVAAEASQEASR